MKRLCSLAAVPALLLVLVSAVLVSGCESQSAGLQVVTSTSLLAGIAEEVGGDRVDVANIIPPAQCPGHFDIKPSDVMKLSEGDVFLMHGWPGEKWAEDLIASAGNPDLVVVVINMQGIASYWMTPPVQSQAFERVAEELAQVDPDSASYYRDNAAAMIAMIEAKGEECQARLKAANVGQVKVMCNEQQADFLIWAGFDVVETYGRPESFNPQKLQELIDTAREEGVTLFVDNLQSGPDAAVGMAEEAGAAQVTLSNFPGGFDDTETWAKAIDRNIDLLLAAIAE